MRRIAAKFKSRCEACEDWILPTHPAIYEDATKQIWHADCDPRDDKSANILGHQQQLELAERLGFIDCSELERRGVLKETA